MPMHWFASVEAMSTLLNIMQRYCEATSLCIAEAIWPTRCSICDLPGASLCQDCKKLLPYIDLWRACPRCGSSFGLVQCCDCNGSSLEALNRSTPAYDACVSAVEFNSCSAKIIHSWKDLGQRSVAYDMASIMSSYIPPEWLKAKPIITPIPASRDAKRRRGFDHGADLANELGLLLNLPVEPLLKPPNSKDQRKLDKRERLNNMLDGFTVAKGHRMPEAVIVTDDVHTTGATLYAAADALHSAGVLQVWGLTFARA